MIFFFFFLTYEPIQLIGRRRRSWRPRERKHGREFEEADAAAAAGSIFVFVISPTYARVHLEIERSNSAAAFLRFAAFGVGFGLRRLLLVVVDHFLLYLPHRVRTPEADAADEGSRHHPARDGPPLCCCRRRGRLGGLAAGVAPRARRAPYLAAGCSGSRGGRRAGDAGGAAPGEGPEVYVELRGAAGAAPSPVLFRRPFLGAKVGGGGQRRGRGWGRRRRGRSARTAGVGNHRQLLEREEDSVDEELVGGE